jgi:uncharacterized protein (TIGR00730 family)
MGRELGVALAARGDTLVSGGGRTGMMGSLAAGARSGGARTIGVVAEALAFLEMADGDSDDLINTVDLGERKNVMIDKADAFVILPGGLGTLDELFEVWTTASLGLHDKPVVLVNTAGFYTGLVEWLRGLVPTGFVRAEAMERLIVVESVEAVLDVI